MKTSPLHSHALEFYVHNAYSIIPLGKDKRPLLRSWKQYQTEAADEEQIEKWWTQWPNANIGIVTGKVSGITVIDVDTYKGGDISPFPETYTVKTGNGGYHLYYEYQPGLTISANAYAQFPGVDMRSDGGFVVAPYSVTDYQDPHTKQPKGGLYEITKNIPLTKFPTALFPIKKDRRTLGSKIGVTTGGRNDSITSFIGQVLHASPEEEWMTEAWDAVRIANNTYKPPLPERELKATFESIINKEKARRASLIVSPIQLEGGETLNITIRKNKAGSAFKDMANVVLVLSQHPLYKHALRYNEFRQEIEYNGRSLEDKDIRKIQHFMQVDAALESVSEQVVMSAIAHYATQHTYDEAQDWLTSLEWDGVERLKNWIHQASGVEDDEYHSGIGAQWFMGMIRRIMQPGAQFDHVLLLVGAQGIGKTSFFRILGGKWYKSYTGAMDSKDFYLTLRGAIILDLDEGAALYHSEAIKIKSIITETHDEFRAPYDRVTKKYPRRFVFSMSTNDTEPFRDATGNRRYWAIDAEEKINFDWLTENRDQLFAETYHYWKDKIAIPEVPQDRAEEVQEMHLSQDPWLDHMMEILQKAPEYREGSLLYSTTIPELYKEMFPDEDLSRLGRAQEMRMANLLKKHGGFVKRRTSVEGERRMVWVLTSKRIAQLKKNPLPDTRDMFDLTGLDEEE